MSLSTLEVLYAAKARLEKPRTRFVYTDWTACTCGHIYAAARGRRAEDPECVYNSKRGKHHDALLVTARALGWQGDGVFDTPAENAAEYISDYTYECRLGDGSGVTREDATRVINEAIAKHRGRAGAQSPRRSRADPADHRQRAGSGGGMNNEFYGPIWVDPRFLEWRRYQAPWGWTTTTTTTQPVTPAPTVDEERIRKIVREEIADLPIPFDVPDAPPEA